MGVAPAIVAADGDRVFATTFKEPMTRADWTTHDYNVHFILGLCNDGNATSNTEIEIERGRWDKLPDRTPLLYTSSSADGPWQIASFPARTDLGKRYAMRLPIAPGESVFIANTLPRCLDAIVGEADRLAAAGGAQTVKFGRSLHGRPLHAYIFGDSARLATILITSGIHPPEPDTLATAEIMKWLGGQEGKELLNRVAVVVIPVVNPDGYAHGTQAANAGGINMYWHFATELPKRCPEAHALWEFAAGLRPRGYIDFHSYSFQLGKEAGPYLKPMSFYGAQATRLTARRIYARLDVEVSGKSIHGFSTYAPHTLGARLTAAYDTITLAKYHLHLKEGADECRQRGLNSPLTKSALDTSGLV